MPEFEIYSNDDDNTYPAEWFVSPTSDDEEIKAEFEKTYKEIKDELLYGKKPVENPQSVTIGGQPASGKSSLLGLAEEFVFSDENFITIDNDNFRRYHPKYEEIEQAGKLECRPIAEFIRDVRTRLVAELTAEGYNFINHTTMGDNEPCKQLKAQKDRGYKTTVMVMACNDYESRLGIFKRFIENVKDSLTKHARFSVRKKHDKSYNGVVDTLAQAEREGNVDELFVFNRKELWKFRESLTEPLTYMPRPLYSKISDGGRTIRDNLRDNFTDAVDALEYERDLEWSDEKYEGYKQDCITTGEEIGKIYEAGYINTNDHKKMRDELHEMSIEARKKVKVKLVEYPLQQQNQQEQHRPDNDGLVGLT